MKITKTRTKHIIRALQTAIQFEKDFIHCYSNVHDGSEKLPIKNSHQWIQRWQKISTSLSQSLQTNLKRLSRG